MNAYQQWAARHPEAAADLEQTLGAVSQPPAGYDGSGKSEAWAQQQVRFKVPKHTIVDSRGRKLTAMSWRNNVGATPAKCKACGAKQQPTRFGLGNDSAKLNKEIKSSDLILGIPRLITADMAGRTILQFGSVEVKRPGWRYTGNDQEPGQAAWLALIASRGGYATFSTGELNL